jgi:hypothetical protein
MPLSSALDAYAAVTGLIENKGEYLARWSAYEFKQ